MKLFGLAMAALAGVIAAPALGGVVNITGGGGLIPADGTGGSGTWNGGDATLMPHSPFESSVMINGGVASVHAITFTDMVHGFVGDLQAVLYDPNGIGHNIFVRPGVGFNSSIFGSGMDFDGTYTFYESGAPSDLPTVTGGGSSVVPGGDYNQTFSGSATAMGAWENGAQSIFNTPLTEINGGAGQWTLRIFDWTGGDAGSLDSWTLTYIPIIPSPGVLAVLGLAGLVGSRRRRRG